MKKLLFIPLLLAISALVLSQDQTPQTEETEQQEEIFVMEIDYRCQSVMKWSLTMLEGRRKGVTLDSVLNRIAHDMQYGPLRQFEPETIAYMLAVIERVFQDEEVPSTLEENVRLFEDVHNICVEFMDTPAETKYDQISI